MRKQSISVHAGVYGMQSVASGLIYRSRPFQAFGRGGSGREGGRGDFCLPPARSSSAEMDTYFQEGAVIITVEVQRKWLWVVLLLLSHCFWRLAAPCFDCFV